MQFKQKSQRRKDLANLSIEKKLKRLIILQKIAYTIGKVVGRKCRKPWGMKDE